MTVRQNPRTPERVSRVDLQGGRAQVARTDRSTLDVGKTLARTGSGAVRLPARLTRVGVFQYSDGVNTWGELRLPEEVFAAESLASLRGVPLTDLHPAVEVDAGNWRQLAIGHVADDVRADSEWIAATLQISDGGLIRAVELGQRVELSCGYTADIYESPGEYLGIPYRYVQRNIRYNHCALGPSDWARAGRGARVILDSHGKPRQWRRSSTKGSTMAVFKAPSYDLNKGVAVFDGKEYAFADESERKSFLAAFNAHVGAAAVKTDAIEGATIQPMIDEMMGMLAGAHEAAMALAALVASDTGAAPETLAEAEDMMGMETLDALVSERAAVIARAKALAPTVEVKGKKTSEIRRAVLDSIGRKVPQGRGDEYVAAVFDTLPVQSFSADDRLTVDSGAPGGDAAAVVEAHQNLRKARSKQWRKGKAAK